MKILTFGSCMSKFTAVRMNRLYNAEVVSAVFHNRSDAFIGRFVEKTWKDYPIDEVGKYISPDDGQVQSEYTAASILNNQYPERIGLHNLSGNKSLFDVLDEQDIDLIIADNHMDLGARLSSIMGEPNAGVFLRFTDMVDENAYWRTGNLLDIDQAVESMQKVLDYLKAKLPKAKVVFINFPHNVYAGSQRRIERTKEYERLFQYEDAFIFPCLTVPKVYQTEERQHFTLEQYNFYAGAIYNYWKKSQDNA